MSTYDIMPDYKSLKLHVIMETMTAHQGGISMGGNENRCGCGAYVDSLLLHRAKMILEALDNLHLPVIQ